ncbi:AraC family transcriptional regulator [Mucilaginibacter pedocola]|uniref:HTH araC/xylS-type domain-containing protein n=1 Tax=Mucilaginibacter pedocola TaxID=1792845 RepID=A0A1S9PJQ4_9SPHI|nr:AraC family transcriptional regulator [Mucilaginibacter pedocola]OOQ61191.1 hypothetical protein BC343_22390 [Mucilaginibacter pedocola]
MLKPTLEPLPHQNEHPLLVRTFELDEFHSPYHFHPEYELTAITKGEGNRFVGNNMSAYAAGDLVLLGPNVPHCWKNTTQGEVVNAASIVVQFDKTLLGDGFFERHRARHVAQLMEASVHGIHFSGAGTQQVIGRMHDMASAGTPYKKLIILLEVFDMLAEIPQQKLLNEEAIVYTAAPHHHHRLNAVQDFIIGNFRNKITLPEIAGVAKMSANAFCKYYKQQTGKTFTEAIVAYRLNYAMQQLLNTHKTVTDICFECGFTDLAFFYKVFKTSTGSSPAEYRKEYMRRLSSVG